MKILIIGLLCLYLFSCKERKNISTGSIPSTIIIDSCEYLQWANYNGTISEECHIIHKGNCKNCGKVNNAKDNLDCIIKDQEDKRNNKCNNDDDD